MQPQIESGDVEYDSGHDDRDHYRREPFVRHEKNDKRPEEIELLFDGETPQWSERSLPIAPPREVDVGEIRDVPPPCGSKRIDCEEGTEPDGNEQWRVEPEKPATEKDAKLMTQRGATRFHGRARVEENSRDEESAQDKEEPDSNYPALVVGRVISEHAKKTAIARSESSWGMYSRFMVSCISGGRSGLNSTRSIMSFVRAGDHIGVIREVSNVPDPKAAGRIVIITGGAGGVGSTVSRRWLDAGASVLIVDQRQAAIDAWLSEFSQPGWVGRVAGLAADVTNEPGAKAMVSEAHRSFGKQPDTLIHLVGGFAAAAVEDENAIKTWDSMIAVNLTAAFHCYRAMLPALRDRNGGWIVGLTSRAAYNPGPRLAAYAASKAALGALTSSLSAEVRSAGIHVNLIVASTIDTPANRKSMGEAEAASWVTPDDIADATMYLCSDSARSVHGATLEVFANA